MNIAGPHAVGLQQHHVDHLDDRRVARILPGAGIVILDIRDINIPANRPFELRRSFLGGTVIFLQRLVDRIRSGTHELEFALQKMMERIERIEIQRIADGDHQPGIRFSHRNHPESPRHVLVDLGNHLPGDGHLRQVDEIHRRMRGQRARDVFLRQDTFGHQAFNERSLRGNLFAHPFELRFRDEARFEQDFENVFVVGSHVGREIEAELW